MTTIDKGCTITAVYESGFYSGGDWRVWLRDKDDTLLATATSRRLWRAVKRAVKDHERKVKHAARFH